jgi:hypothetical protein
VGPSLIREDGRTDGYNEANTYYYYYEHSVHISVHYLLFVPTNTHTYIKISNYITNASACFSASASSTGSLILRLVKL